MPSLQDNSHTERLINEMHSFMQSIAGATGTKASQKKIEKSILGTTDLGNLTNVQKYAVDVARAFMKIDPGQIGMMRDHANRIAKIVGQATKATELTKDQLAQVVTELKRFDKQQQNIASVLGEVSSKFEGMVGKFAPTFGSHFARAASDAAKSFGMTEAVAGIAEVAAPLLATVGAIEFAGRAIYAYSNMVQRMQTEGVKLQTKELDAMRASYVSGVGLAGLSSYRRAQLEQYQSDIVDIGPSSGNINRLAASGIRGLAPAMYSSLIESTGVYASGAGLSIDAYATSVAKALGFSSSSEMRRAGLGETISRVRGATSTLSGQGGETLFGIEFGTGSQADVLRRSILAQAGGAFGSGAVGQFAASTALARRFSTIFDPLMQSVQSYSSAFSESEAQEVIATGRLTSEALRLADKYHVSNAAMQSFLGNITTATSLFGANIPSVVGMFEELRDSGLSVADAQKRVIDTLQGISQTPFTKMLTLTALSGKFTGFGSVAQYASEFAQNPLGKTQELGNMFSFGDDKYLAAFILSLLGVPGANQSTGGVITTAAALGQPVSTTNVLPGISTGVPTAVTSQVLRAGEHTILDKAISTGVDKLLNGLKDILTGQADFGPMANTIGVSLDPTYLLYRAFIRGLF